jgi:hypothetical protein
MGRFLNPDYSAFETALNSEIYIDKTGLLAYTNKVINTKQAFICNSRPRRFGKSVTADMLTAKAAIQQIYLQIMRLAMQGISDSI